MGAKHHKPALIAAVRRCAEAGMSAMQAADRLSTSERPLTKGSIIGLANRNGIKFGAKPGTRKPRAVQESKPRPTPSGPRCSWAGCGHDAHPGDMFCYSHSRMPLFGKVTPCV